MKVSLPLYVWGKKKKGSKKLGKKKSEMFHRGRLSLMLMLI